MALKGRNFPFELQPSPAMGLPEPLKSETGTNPTREVPIFLGTLRGREAFPNLGGPPKKPVSKRGTNFPLFKETGSQNFY